MVTVKFSWCFFLSAITKLVEQNNCKIKQKGTKCNTITRIYVSLQTTSHIHSDKWLKGLRAFPGFGDEENPQETESRSVEKAR